MIRGTLLSTLWVLASLTLQACSSLEVVSDVPSKKGTAKISHQNLGLYQKPIHIFDQIDLSRMVAAKQMPPRVDNVVVLIDRARSENRDLRGVPSDIYSSELFRRFLLTLPDQFTLYAGSTGEGATPLANGIPLFDKNRVLGSSSAIVDVPVLGSDLHAALKVVGEKLSNVRGSVAIITIAPWEQFTTEVVSDLSRIKQYRDFKMGMHIGESAEQWRDSAVEGLCLMQLGLGNKLSSSVVGALEGCVVSKASDQVFQPEDMAGFIASYLYSFPEDSDRDGIPNYRDQCPQTDGKRVVDFSGCAVFK